MVRLPRVWGLSIGALLAVTGLAWASGYALAVVEILRLRPEGDVAQLLTLGTTLGWPTVDFARVVVPGALYAMVAGVYAARGTASPVVRWPMTPTARAALVHAPLLISPWVLGQLDVVRRGPLVALCFGASAALCAWLASANSPPSVADESPVEPSPRGVLSRVRPHAPVLVLMLAHFALFAFLAIRRDAALWSATVDLGIFKEALWNTLHGRPLHSPTVGYSFLGEHFSPILFALAPLYGLFPTSATLLIVQTGAISLAAWPIYRLALHHGLGRRLATLVAGSMLVAPAMQHSMMYDFHMDLLGVPALAWAIHAAERRRHVTLIVSAAVLCAVKEDAFLALLGIAMAAYFGNPRDRKRVPIVVALVATVYCLVAILVLIKRFGPPPGVPEYMAAGGPPTAYKFARNFRHLTNGSHGPVRTLLGMPIRFALYAVTDARLTSALVLGAPVLLSSLFAGARIFVLVPLGILLLSDNPEIVGMRYHYGAIHHPTTYAAAIFGMAAWVARCHPERRVAMQRALESGVIAATLVMVAMHPGSMASDANTHDSRRVTARVRRTNALAALVPADGRATVTSFGGARFSNRRELWMYPQGVDRADWAFVDLQRPAWPSRPDSRDGLVVELLHSRVWGAVGWGDGAIVLARGHDASHNRTAVRDTFLRRSYEVEGTEQTDYPNAIESDPDASDGYARVVRPTDRRSGQWVVFGPYIRLPPGHWTVTFRVRAEPTRFPADIGAVDIFSQGRTIVNHALTPEDVEGGRWHDVPLEFDSIGASDLEFRVRTDHGWILAADRISLRVDDEHAVLRHLGF